MRKVCIVGAGAIGGCLGSRLAAAGAEVSAIARGATAEALRRHGWRLHSGDERLQAPAAAVVDAADAAALGPQDLDVLTVKAQALAEVAPAVAALLGSRTVLLPAMNGVPWWFGHGLGGPARDIALRSVDPDGGIAQALPAGRVIGCVVHIAASTAEPGVALQRMGRGLMIGEPLAGAGDPPSARLAAVKSLLVGAGFDASVPARIHEAVWYKLWGNVTMNPVSALTGATADRILDDDLVRAHCTAVMQEVAAVGARIGCAIDQSPADHHAVTRKLGAFKTSMLQDVEAGGAIGLDAIVAAVREIAERVGVSTPQLDTLYGLTRLMARTRGLYPPAR